MDDPDLLHHLLRHSAPPESPPAPPDNTAYFQIWQIEQQHMNSRWTVATFFFSISFAIFGFSFQAYSNHLIPQIARISGMLIYWFAFLLFRRFNTYTEILRTLLYEMEITGKTTLDLQQRVRQRMRRDPRRRVTATRLLLAFGILYTLGVAALWWFNL